MSHNSTGKFDKSIAKSICTTNELLRRLLNKPEIEALNPIPLCVDGEITGYIAFQRNEETNDLLEFYFDLSFNQITEKPLGEACAAKDDIEYKYFEEEKCLEDGTKVKEVLCLVYRDGVLTDESTFWIVNGAKVDVDPGVQECVTTQVFLGEPIDVCLPPPEPEIPEVYYSHLTERNYTAFNSKPAIARLEVDATNFLFGPQTVVSSTWEMNFDGIFDGRTLQYTGSSAPIISGNSFYLDGIQVGDGFWLKYTATLSGGETITTQMFFQSAPSTVGNGFAQLDLARRFYNQADVVVTATDVTVEDKSETENGTKVFNSSVSDLIPDWGLDTAVIDGTLDFLSQQHPSTPELTYNYPMATGKSIFSAGLWFGYPFNAPVNPLNLMADDRGMEYLIIF